MRRYRNIPPFQFLQGFEAASRLGSFSKAAEELGLSQSAVSHQMRLLEDRLGQKLFLRVGRHVTPTDAGRDYGRTVARVLDELEAGYRRLEPYRKPGSIVIYAPLEFATRWLMPRLPDLMARCPGAAPWIDTSERPIDFEEMEVSLAVISAEAPPSGLEAARLLPDRIAPVLSPRLIKGRRRITPADLLGLPRLNSEHAVRWEDWMAAAGIEAGAEPEGLDFSDRDLALTAAEQGLGVALASLPLAGAALRSGALLAPFREVVEPARVWYAVSTAKELTDPLTLAVWRWVAAEAEAAVAELEVAAAARGRSSRPLR
jgi:LysR family glycine cleavage system transcriptional activator